MHDPAALPDTEQTEGTTPIPERRKPLKDGHIVVSVIEDNGDGTMKMEMSHPYPGVPVVGPSKPMGHTPLEGERVRFRGRMEAFFTGADDTIKVRRFVVSRYALCIKL